MNKYIEITAPVGNFEMLASALRAGAKSVYFGVGKLNMRARSTVNFIPEDLPKIVRLCNAVGAKSYLALNTIIYDGDFAEMRKSLEFAKKSGVSAIIASDVAVFGMAKEMGLTLHGSTQLNISNIEALKFYSRYIDVAVLARELSLDQVAEITDQVEKQNVRGPSGNLLKIEVFAHGALCMAVSGKCYLSLHEWNKSANRGACLQTCRRSYTVIDNESGYELEIDNEYIMSPKDLCTIHFLDRIIDSGVGILKIEGRGRSPEYVKTTVECYREAIDAVNDSSYSAEKIESWRERLATVYNRGFWDGYYLGQKIGEWSPKYGSSATKKKVYAGDITNYYSKIGVAEVTLRGEHLNIGDDILIIGNTTGAVYDTVQEIHTNNSVLESAPKGSVISIRMKVKVRKSDKLYKLIDA